MPTTIDPFDENYKHLMPFPDATLRDIARNDAAPRDYRKRATEVLWFRKSPYVHHQDLREFVEELEIEFDGIQLEFPAPEPPTGMTASVTTKTMFGSEDMVMNDEAPAEENTRSPKKVAKKKEKDSDEPEAPPS